MSDWTIVHQEEGEEVDQALEGWRMMSWMTGGLMKQTPLEISSCDGVGDVEHLCTVPS